MQRKSSMSNNIGPFKIVRPNGHYAMIEGAGGLRQLCLSCPTIEEVLTFINMTYFEGRADEKRDREKQAKAAKVIYDRCDSEYKTAIDRLNSIAFGFPVTPREPAVVTRKYIGGPMDGKSHLVNEDMKTHEFGGNSFLVSVLGHTVFTTKHVYKLGTVNGEPMFVYGAEAKKDAK